MFERFIINLQAKYRRETLEGRPHLVVPAVILKETVITGNKGPILYPAIENAKSVSDWNHMPIVVDHPKDKTTFVSARSPAWINARKVGLLLNTSHSEKLATECWFDEERVKRVDKRVYEAIINERPMEVSTGLGADVEETTGSLGGIPYTGIARNYKPDHLAILPDTVGALSIKMGGGLFANEAGNPEGLVTVMHRSVVNALAFVGAELTANELSFSTISRSLSDLLGAKYGKPGQYWEGYVREVYPSGTVIFSDGTGKLWKMSFTAAGDGVTLTGEAVQVVQTTSYQTLDGKTRFLRNEAGELTEVPQQETSMAFDKTAHLTSLIGNGGYTEADRAFLSGLPDDQLARIKPVQAASPPPVLVPPAATTPVVANAQPLTREQVMAMLPADFMQIHAQGQIALQQRRTALVNQIKASPNNAFTDEGLAAITDINQLAAIASLATPATTPASDPRYVPGFNAFGDYAGAAVAMPGLVGNQQGSSFDPPEAGLNLPGNPLATAAK